MATIKTTHIDTGGHGYYSVSKKDIQTLGISDKISGYSGQTLDRVYLEEDCDATLLYDRAKELNIKIDCKSGYNPKFSVNHNYNPDLFAWVPEVGNKIMIGKSQYQIILVNKKMLIIENNFGKGFRLSLSNPFSYITSVLN